MYSIIYTRHSNPDIWLVSQIAFKKKKKKKKVLTSKSHSSPTAYLVMISNQAVSTNFSKEAVLW